MRFRRHRPHDDQHDELNLAPIMNLVIILIPMLLLSVVFLSVGVFNVSSPSICGSTGCSKPTTTEPLSLMVTVVNDGIVLSARSKIMAPVEGCPPEGPTICLDADRHKPDWRRVRQLAQDGDVPAAEDALHEALEAYPMHELYNTLARLKAEHPYETKITIGADPNVPYAAVVRVVDIARYKLAKPRYDNASAFVAANYGPTRKALFPDPSFAVVH